MNKRTLLFIFILFMSIFLGACVIHIDYYTYDNADEYTKYSDIVNIEEEIKKVRINWVSGHVTISKAEKAAISEENKKGEYLPLYYLIKDGTLTIQYCASGTKVKVREELEKDLLVALPASLEEIELDVVSCSYNIYHDSLNMLKINVVSGKGDIILESLRNLDLDSVSGNTSIKINDTSLIEKIDADTVSGYLLLTINSNRGYILDMDTISGKAHTDFTEGKDTTLSKFLIDFNSVSGDIYISEIL